MTKLCVVVCFLLRLLLHIHGERHTAIKEGGRGAALECRSPAVEVNTAVKAQLCRVYLKHSVVHSILNPQKVIVFLSAFLVI